MEHLPIERRVRLSPAAGSPRPAAGERSCRLLIIGLCRTKFANFIGSWARRRWKRRFSKRPSNTPQGKKNNCGCRRGRRRTVPDEDRGRGHRRLPPQSCGPSTGTVQETNRWGSPRPDDELVSKIKAVIAGLLSIATLAGTSGALTAALQWMNVTGVGAPTALRSAATTASGCGLRLRSTAVIGKP